MLCPRLLGLCPQLQVQSITQISKHTQTKGSAAKCVFPSNQGLQEGDEGYIGAYDSGCITREVDDTKSRLEPGYEVGGGRPMVVFEFRNSANQVNESLRLCSRAPLLLAESYLQYSWRIFKQVRAQNTTTSMWKD